MPSLCGEKWGALVVNDDAVMAKGQAGRALSLMEGRAGTTVNWIKLNSDERIVMKPGSKRFNTINMLCVRWGKKIPHARKYTDKCCQNYSHKFNLKKYEVQNHFKLTFNNFLKKYCTNIKVNRCKEKNSIVVKFVWNQLMIVTSNIYSNSCFTFRIDAS